ncbi:hypothetical protein [Nocardia harenae]|uniref:hypothetical protein n=1 Tax=Nocardia harenae TaxID=358707 RepID=UPI0008311299|nr:hypothetical protein [Nocardia harenae]
MADDYGEATAAQQVGPVEIRVHGIGDHDPYSALGSPVFQELTPDQVTVADQPRPMPHRLRLVNWSRSNRKKTRTLLWYLAFPFTLMNVAAYMRPYVGGTAAGKVGDRLFRGLMVVPALCLTAATAAWLIVIFETMLRSSTLMSSDAGLRGAVAWVPPSILGMFIIVRVGRSKLRDRSDHPAWLIVVSVLHLSVLAATALWAATRMAEPSTAAGPVDLVAEPEAITPMIALVGLTTLAVGCCALVLALISAVCRWRTASNERAGTHLAGAALLILLAITVLHAAGSMLRVTVEEVLTFLVNWASSRIGTVASTVEQRRAALEAAGRDGYVLLPSPAEDGLEDAIRLDIIPVFFIAFVLICALALGIALYISRRFMSARAAKTPPRTPPRKPETALHSILGDLNSYLGPATLIIVVCTGAVWWWAGDVVLGTGAATMNDVLRFIQAGSFVIVVLLIVRRPERLGSALRAGFSSLADIAGFWLPDAVPLAGASYRPSLMAGLGKELKRPDYAGHRIALVGHSQGSIACAWFVSKELTGTPLSDQLMLVTCGSPLATLYRTFFPRYFDGPFFDRAKDNCCGGWHNYYRVTDPISSPVCNESERYCLDHDATEEADGPLYGHSNYWIDPAMTTRIHTYLTEPGQPGREASRGNTVPETVGAA